MGVDYDANYGIGIQVEIKEFEEDSEYQDDFLTYLDDILEDSNYSYFQVGSSNYTGGEDDVYVTIDNPFDEGLNIEQKAKDLISFLESNEIKYYGKVDLVGGLRIW